MDIYGLPDCKLIRALQRKASQRTDINFKFISVLDDFREEVSAEMEYMKVLFPQYTPHDEKNHLSRLFFFADKLLGDEKIQKMNASELFVLAVSLYGHDWGMAVSESEKKLVIYGEVTVNKTVNEQPRELNDELRHIKEFAHKRNIKLNTNDRFEEISEELWSDYVRETHAYRSGERVKQFFENKNSSIAEAARNICVGHWLDAEDMQDPINYPQQSGVLGEIVNIRALAVYLRLIDLFDISEYRTPYIIWKYVAPTDYRSRMEWAKHRAIKSVDILSYMNDSGRQIVVEGSTEDYEVYDELERLRIYCQDQLESNRDILAQMKDNLYFLDIYRVDWKVKAKGFNQSKIQFEFQRERMFEILSDEIYQGDPYVFLRELLQNSIDAIRMRREILQRNEIPSKDLGAIWVTVNHTKNGDSEIIWRDNGIGMNEYIVRNYLAIAGKSYYQSEDFIREGLKMDPISRFGIGILSCFLAADHIEIVTRRDKYYPPDDGTLQVIIPSKTGRFLIKPHEKEAEVGTTVRIFVKGDKIHQDDKNKFDHLDVTEYLQIIAGFVEFPIIISEGKKRTIILHPKETISKVIGTLGDEYNEYEEHKLSLDLPWESTFVADDLELAHQVLKEETIDLSQDLDLSGYEGVFAYFVPSDEHYDFRAAGTDEEGYQLIEVLNRRNVNENKSLRYDTEWDETFEYYNFCNSAKISKRFNTYVDGILVPFNDIPTLILNNTEEILPPPILKVNIRKAKLNIGRTGINEKRYNWEAQIYRAYFKNFCNNYSKNLLSVDVKERLFKLARIITYHHFKVDDILNNFPENRLPVPILKMQGELKICEFQDIRDTARTFVPEVLSNEIKNILYSNWFDKVNYDGYLKKWKGEECIISSYTISSGTIEHAASLFSYLKERYYYPSSIQFLRPIENGQTLIPQRIYEPMNIHSKTPPLKDVLSAAYKNPLKLTSYDLITLNRLLRRFNHESPGRFNPATPEIVIFEKPFENHFAYGFEYLNLGHNVVQQFVRCLALTQLNNVLSTFSRTRVESLIQRILRINSPFEGIIMLDEIKQSIEELFAELKNHQVIDSNIEVVISPKEFIAGTILENQEGSWMIHKIKREQYRNLFSRQDIDPYHTEYFGEKIV